MRNFGGPRAGELRLGLGADRNLSHEVVPTAGQAGAFSSQDRQNNGYSGTPMWKLALERAQREQASAASAPAAKIPDGFKPVEQIHENQLPPSKRPVSGGRWFYSEKRQVFWNATDLKMYVLDPASRQPAELHDSMTSELRAMVGACFHENAVQTRHVLVKDLVKAAQSLRLSIDHLDQPCAIYALYEGHRGTPSASNAGNSCAEFCAKNLHQKLLLKLSAFRGYWDDKRLEATMQEIFVELDNEYCAKHPSAVDGCSALVALVTGERLVLASVGDVAGVIIMQNGEAREPLKPHALRDPDDDDDDSDDQAGGPAAAESAIRLADAPIRWTRAFGDSDFKRPGSAVQLSAVPDVSVIYLNQQYRGVALVCRALYNAIGKSVAVSTVFRRSRGRPRIASGALVDAAVQWMGKVEVDIGLGSIVVFFDGIEENAASPQKRRKTEQPTQVRLRHILLKHKECKSTVDKVRNKQVKRTRGEAERMLRAVLEECEVDALKCTKAFTQRCREISECSTSLTAGDLAGDLGWVKPGKNEAKFGPSFDTAAFALQIGQLSDIIDSDSGVHILLRAA